MQKNTQNAGKALDPERGAQESDNDWLEERKGNTECKGTIAGVCWQREEIAPRRGKKDKTIMLFGRPHWLELILTATARMLQIGVKKKPRENVKRKGPERIAERRRGTGAPGERGGERHYNLNIIATMRAASRRGEEKKEKRGGRRPTSAGIGPICKNQPKRCQSSCFTKNPQRKVNQDLQRGKGKGRKGKGGGQV